MCQFFGVSRAAYYAWARRLEQPDPDGLLLHSDHGYQYASHDYASLTQDYSITPSMSRRGNSWDNEPMESFFGHLKEEALRPYPSQALKKPSK